MDDQAYLGLVEFIRRLRHDANNPLTAAMGNVQLLLEDAHTLDPDTTDTLRTVESELRRLLLILRRLNEIRPDAPPPVWDPPSPA